MNLRGACWTRILGVTAAVAALVLASVPAAQGAETLATSSKQIFSFAQDGPFVAWTAGRGRYPCPQPRIEYLPTGMRRNLGNIGCAFRIAIGGGRALWVTPPALCGICYGAAVGTGSFWHPRRSKRIGEFEEDVDDVGGKRLTGIAADKRLRVLSYVNYLAPASDPCWETNVECSSWEIGGGRIDRLVEGVREPIGRQHAALLAAGGGHIAFAPALDPSDGPPVKPAEDGPVDVVDGAGALVAEVVPTGTARALAVSRTEVAILLEKNDGSRVIERYLLADQALVAATPASNAGERGFDMAGKWIVYHIRREIFAVDRTGTPQHVLTLQAHPIDLSIERQRIAWAENHNGHHRIRAVAPPT